MPAVAMPMATRAESPAAIAADPRILRDAYHALEAHGWNRSALARFAAEVARVSAAAGAALRRLARGEG